MSGGGGLLFDVEEARAEQHDDLHARFFIDVSLLAFA